MADFYARTVTELHGLARQREHRGNEGLRGNHGGGRRQDYQRQYERRRRNQIERRFGCFGIRQQHRALPEVIEQQARHHEAPREANRGCAEVSDVRVKRFAARDHKEDGTEHDKAVIAILDEERDGMCRVRGREDARRVDESI